jgi:hypothetical protein
MNLQLFANTALALRTAFVLGLRMGAGDGAVRVISYVVSEARDLLHEEWEQRQYPIREIETLSETPELIELAATLVPATANPDELDAVTRHLERHDGIESATWTVSTGS